MAILDLISECDTERTCFRAAEKVAYSPVSFLAEGFGRLAASSLIEGMIPVVYPKTKEDSLQERHEAGNNAVDKIRELMNRFEQRLTLDNPRFIQRYIESKLHILIHFLIGSTHEEFVALLQREESVSGLEEQTDCGDFLTGKRLPHERRHIRSEVKTLVHGTHGYQEAVFFNIVKSVETPEKVIPTLVRLERVDGIECLLPRSLYFSVLFGFIFRGVIRDGEVNPIRVWRMPPRVARNQLIGEMVQGTHEVLDGVTGDKRETFRSRLDTGEIINQFSRCRVALGSDFVGVGFEELADFPIKVRDVLFGPFDF